MSLPVVRSFSYVSVVCRLDGWLSRVSHLHVTDHDKLASNELHQLHESIRFVMVVMVGYPLSLMSRLYALSLRWSFSTRQLPPSGVRSRLHSRSALNCLCRMCRWVRVRMSASLRRECMDAIKPAESVAD